MAKICSTIESKQQSSTCEALLRSISCLIVRISPCAAALSFCIFLLLSWMLCIFCDLFCTFWCSGNTGNNTPKRVQRAPLDFLPWACAGIPRAEILHAELECREKHRTLTNFCQNVRAAHSSCQVKGALFKTPGLHEVLPADKRLHRDKAWHAQISSPHWSAGQECDCATVRLRVPVGTQVNPDFKISEFLLEQGLKTSLGSGLKLSVFCTSSVPRGNRSQSLLNERARFLGRRPTTAPTAQHFSSVPRGKSLTAFAERAVYGSWLFQQSARPRLEALADFTTCSSSTGAVELQLPSELTATGFSTVGELFVIRFHALADFRTYSSWPSTGSGCR